MVSIPSFSVVAPGITTGGFDMTSSTRCRNGKLSSRARGFDASMPTAGPPTSDISPPAARASCSCNSRHAFSASASVLTLRARSSGTSAA